MRLVKLPLFLRNKAKTISESFVNGNKKIMGVLRIRCVMRPFIYVYKGLDARRTWVWQDARLVSIY